MSGVSLKQRFQEVSRESISLPGGGATGERLARLMEAGREDLSLAKLVEAHWDAVSILAEAGHTVREGSTYGVWAAEMPGASVCVSRGPEGWMLSGTKAFCSGSDLVDRALVTVAGAEPLLLDVDLRANAGRIAFDGSFWRSQAFAGTRTATAIFTGAIARDEDVVGGPGWYLARPGFWHGALGPAACWAGGALGLVEYARTQKRRDAHTLAHLGAMEAALWAMRSYLEQAGEEIDAAPADAEQARVRALTVRHLVEQACTDVLRRFARAYGPYPLAADEAISRRYMELDLYLRQSHAERDLEALGAALIGT